MRIENWEIVATGTPYTAPELMAQSLQGNIYGDTRFEDGSFIITTSIVRITEDEMVVTQSGSAYTLGMPHPRYEAKYPDARNRIIASLKQL